MAKINIKDSGKYSSNGGDFLQLKDDGDVAKVRFLYDDPDGGDLDYYLVHKVKIGDKERYVACNAVDDEGHMHTDDCPLCKAGKKPQEKLFLQCVDESDGTLKVWERGKNFVATVVSFLNRYGSLVAQPIEIERHGKKGDTNTTYQLFACQADNAKLEDYPPKNELEGSLIIKASKDDMYDMLDGVYTIESNTEQEEEPPRRERRSGREEESPRRERRSRERNRRDEF